MKDVLNYRKRVTLENVVKMQDEIEDMVLLVEQQNEVLMFKLKNNDPVFATLVRDLIMANSFALSSLVSARKMLDDSVMEYLLNHKEKGAL